MDFLQALKGVLPFRLAATSFIIPEAIPSNLRFLGSLVDEVELVLFETPEQSNLPSSGEIREMARLAEELSLTFNIHLPADLFFADPDRQRRQSDRETVLRFYERTLPLEPTLYILHLDSRKADGRKETDREAWTGRVSESLDRLISSGLDPQMVAVENLEYPLERIVPLAEKKGLKLCLDIGHLLLYGHSLASHVEAYLERLAMLHLHGVSKGVDHVGVQAISKQSWGTLCEALASFRGGVTLEVFSLDDFKASMWRLARFAAKKRWLEDCVPESCQTGP